MNDWYHDKRIQRVLEKLSLVNRHATTDIDSTFFQRYNSRRELGSVINGWSECSDPLSEIFKIVGSTNIAEIIALSVENDLFSFEQGVDFLDNASWISFNGEPGMNQLIKTIESWVLLGDDQLRVGLGLCYHIGVGAKADRGGTTEEYQELLASLARKFPIYKELCAVRHECSKFGY